MATFKEMVEKRRHLEKQIEILEAILSEACKPEGILSSYEEEDIDFVLTIVDESCLTPLRDELVGINEIEIEIELEEEEDEDEA